uniref:Uncharacterized protein n=1 Tax=Davidia involucrata TaxID=16924 RepID=A0A5B6YNR2_DAVIN
MMMMLPAESSIPQTGEPVVVIGPQFCVSYPVDLAIVKKLMAISEGNFGVVDVKGNVIFKVKGKLFSIRDRRTLLDYAGNPVVTLQQKMISAHRRWLVFRGESTDTKDLIFSAKKSSLIQIATRIDVFLASNTAEKVCDFKVKGSYMERSCEIYLGDSSTVIARMMKQHNIQSMALGKDTFGVIVYPKIDFAFIVALVVVLNEINEDRRD